MSFGSRKKLLGFGLVLLALVAIPATIQVLQQQQETRSRAEKTVTLSYEPTSTQAAPLLIPAGTTFSLDVFIDPGPSAVSYVKAELVYDTSKFESAGGFIPNQEAFSQVIETTNTPGKATASLSVGSDSTKAIRAKTKIGTLALKALATVAANAETSVTFGAGSQALAVSENASYDENVIASTIPATIRFNKPGATCGTAPSDTMLILDKSGSMLDKAGTNSTKIASAKTAASNFVDIIAAESRNNFGLATFASTGTLNTPLSNNASTVKSQINAINPNGGTCIECGINKANQEISAKKRTGIKNIVVLLTDGKANFVEGNSREVAVTTAETKAINAAISGHNANGTIFFTIGLGNDVNSPFLTKLAESTGGQYYFSPTTEQLNSVYNQISLLIAKGSVAGYVFNDNNSNKVKDASEENLPGMVLQMSSSTQSMQTATTDSTGNYTFTYLCDGTYTVKQVMQSGWRQTTPVNPSDYTFTITNGNAITDKNFGNNKGTRCSDTIDNDTNGFIDSKDSTCHTDGDPNNASSYDPNKDGERGTATCSDSVDNNYNGKTDGADPVCHQYADITKPYDPNLPEESTSTPTPTADFQAAKFSLDAVLHGIGAGGDNANPTGNSLSNKNPLNPIQSASIKIHDDANQLLASAVGNVTYSSQSGSYKGVLTTDKAIPAGTYTIRVTVDRHLTRLVPGIQTISLDTTNNIAGIALVAGDITRDNKIDIRDYNLLLECYGDLTTPVNCTDPQKKKDSDINDDGPVNQIDYNLFLREISTQPGE